MPQPYGKRLDIPAGSAVRFEPRDTTTVNLVAIAGNQIITGGNNLATGKLSDANKAAALQRIGSNNFKNNVLSSASVRQIAQHGQ